MRTSFSRRAVWQVARAAAVVVAVVVAVVAVAVVAAAVARGGVVVGPAPEAADRGEGEGERWWVRCAEVVGLRRGLGWLLVGLLRGLSGAGEEVPLRAARGGGAMKLLVLLLVLLLLLPPPRVAIGDVRGCRGGERGLFGLVPLAPVPGAARRLAGEAISLRGIRGVVEGSVCVCSC
jgi:hypothetical protein